MAKIPIKSHATYLHFVNNKFELRRDKIIANPQRRKRTKCVSTLNRRQISVVQHGEMFFAC